MSGQGLTITRKEDEQIILILPSGEEVIITLVEAHRSNARIRIKAPQDVEIIRPDYQGGTQ